MCAATKGGLSLADVDVTKEAVIQGRVLRGGNPVAGAYVRLLDSGLHYAEISRLTGASTATITRIASWLNHGEGGYRAMLDRSRDADVR